MKLENKHYSQKINVMHIYYVWLPITMNWLYNQIIYLPDTIENHIVCHKTEHLDQFGLPNLHALNQSTINYYLEKIQIKLGIRNYFDLLIKINQQKKINILHSHFGHVGWENLGAARKLNIPHIVTFYGLDVNYLPQQNPLWYQRYKLLFKEVDIVLCEGSYMGDSIMKLGCPPEKIQVHPLGIEVDKIPYQPRRWVAGQCLRVLIAASFREKKGIPDALEALGQIQEYVPLEITIIGDADNQTRSKLEKQKILNTIQKYNLQSKVRLLGYQPHSVLLQEAYKHHIFISPSLKATDGDTEGGAPVSIIEMAATGIPIVSTFHCDIPQVIKNGVSGLLAQEKDVNAIVDHLKWLLANPDKWVDMTDQGRERVEHRFNVKLQSEKLAQLYYKVTRL